MPETKLFNIEMKCSIILDGGKANNFIINIFQFLSVQYCDEFNYFTR